MENERIFTQICIEIATGKVVNKYRGNQELTNKRPELFGWIEWNKPLPDDINEKEYTLEELEKLE